MAPSLVDLCLSATADELIQGDSDDYVLSGIYELPSELFDGLLRRLAPLALQKLQENLPSDVANIYGRTYDCHGHCHKRRRCGNLDAAWRELYEVRWPGLCQKNQTMTWSHKPKTTSDQLGDWQQMYWEAPLQDCVDAVAETALLPSDDGSIGGGGIPDHILKLTGCKGHAIELASDYLKFSYHCQQFGAYSRSLIIYFTEISNSNLPFRSLSIVSLLATSKIGGPLRKFLHTGICALYADVVGLGSSGIIAAAMENANQGGIEAAQFILTLFPHAQEIVSIGSRYNLMPVVISYGFKASKGGRPPLHPHTPPQSPDFCGQVVDMESTLAELQTHAPCDLKISSWAGETKPYDGDP